MMEISRKVTQETCIKKYNLLLMYFSFISRLVYVYSALYNVCFKWKHTKIKINLFLIKNNNKWRKYQNTVVLMAE